MEEVFESYEKFKLKSALKNIINWLPLPVINGRVKLTDSCKPTNLLRIYDSNLVSTLPENNLKVCNFSTSIKTIDVYIERLCY